MNRWESSKHEAELKALILTPTLTLKIGDPFLLNVSL